jgi:hypothetical protein
MGCEFGFPESPRHLALLGSNLTDCCDLSHTTDFLQQALFSVEQIRYAGYLARQPENSTG